MFWQLAPGASCPSSAEALARCRLASYGCLELARVLVVEDYPPLAKVVAIAIHRAGHQVERVGSVARALAGFGCFDLAVIDLDLPDGLGTDLARELRARGRLGSVIFFTSTKDHELKDAAEELGRVVHKESGVEELMHWVRRTTQEDRAMAQVVGAGPEALRGSRGSGTRKRVR